MIEGILIIGLREKMEESINDGVYIQNRFPVFS